MRINNSISVGTTGGGGVGAEVLLYFADQYHWPGRVTMIGSGSWELNSVHGPNVSVHIVTLPAAHHTPRPAEAEPHF